MVLKPLSVLVAAVSLALGATSALALNPPPGVKIAGVQVPSIVEDGGIAGPEDVLVVVNTNDPMSVQLGAAYMRARKIPVANLVQVALPVKIEVTPAEWAPVEKQLMAINAGKALALAWSVPYRVGPNQAITSAATMGYNATTVWKGACNITRQNPLLQSVQLVNQKTLKSVRPSMLLASYTSYNPAVAWNAPGRWQDPRNAQGDVYLKGILATIQRGIAADATNPTATGYLLTTTDKTRSARDTGFSTTRTRWAERLGAQWLYINQLTNKKDILIYATGLANPDPFGLVGGVQTLTYLPGAEGDTLTSYAGRLYDTYGQGSALEWLRAGATGSFGTVREPCAFTQKFTNPPLLGAYYTHGDTLVEAMWKSLAWQDEGLIIGEPLARPFDKIVTDARADGTLYAYNYGYVAGIYTVWQIADPTSITYAQTARVQLPVGVWVAVGKTHTTNMPVRYVLETPTGVASGFSGGSNAGAVKLYPARQKPAVGF